jgi:hypothetical protein
MATVKTNADIADYEYSVAGQDSAKRVDRHAYQIVDSNKSIGPQMESLLDSSVAQNVRQSLGKLHILRLVCP